VRNETHLLAVCSGVWFLASQSCWENWRCSNVSLTDPSTEAHLGFAHAEGGQSGSVGEKKDGRDRERMLRKKRKGT